MMPISDPCDRFFYPHHTPMKDTLMPISDPRDRFFYPHHTPMKDTYNVKKFIRQGLDKSYSTHKINCSNIFC